MPERDAKARSLLSDAPAAAASNAALRVPLEVTRPTSVPITPAAVGQDPRDLDEDGVRALLADIERDEGVDAILEACQGPSIVSDSLPRTRSPLMGCTCGCTARLVPGHRAAVCLPSADLPTSAGRWRQARSAQARTRPSAVMTMTVAR